MDNGKSDEETERFHPEDGDNAALSYISMHTSMTCEECTHLHMLSVSKVQYSYCDKEKVAHFSI